MATIPFPKAFARSRTFNLRGCSIIVAGIPVSGFSDGDALTITWANDAAVAIEGADGVVQRGMTNSRLADAVMRLQQQNNINAQVLALFRADQLSGDGAFPFICKNPTSGETVTAPTAWIKKYPDMGLARDPGTREWQLQLVGAEMV